MAFAMNNMSFDERFAALDDHKAAFVSKVYTGLTASLAVATVTCIFTMGIFASMPKPAQVSLWHTLLFVQLGLILLSFFVRLSGPFAWLMVGAFVLVTGATLAPVMMLYSDPKYYQPGTIPMALGLTATIFLTLTAYVRYSGKDFSYLGGFLWIATIGLIVGGIALIFFPNSGINYIYSCVGALLFSGWILYDTSAVTRQYYRDNNVPAAVLMLYLDVLNLFLFLLDIVGGGRRRD